MILPPVKAFPQPDRRSVVYEFPKNSSMPDGEYYVRGGVCWPIEQITVRGDRIAEGFVLLCGHDVRTWITYVMASERFRCIDHVVQDSRIKFQGIAPWFNAAWTTYYATHFYYRGDVSAHLTYLKQVRESQLISPKPHFIEVEWKNDSIPMAQLWQHLQTERLKYAAGGEIGYEVQKQKQDIVPAGVLALMACIRGYEQYPWRRP